MPRDTYAFEQITVAATAIGLTASNLRDGTDSTREVSLNVQDAQLRYRLDGTNPTSTVGQILNPMDRLTLTVRAEIDSFRAIRTGATSAILNVHYRR